LWPGTRTRTRTRALPMLIVDGNDHEVFEVDAAHVWVGADHEPLSMHFDDFERMACELPPRGFLGNLADHRRCIATVQLCDSATAWGPTVSIRDDSCSLLAELGEFGSEILFVWPTSTSIHAFLEIKEAARRRGAGGGAAPPGTGAPRPALDFLPRKRAFGCLDVPDARRLETRELTVAQRILMASLAPTSTQFPQKTEADTWAEQLERQDAIAFRRFGKSQRAARGDDGAAPSVAPRAPRAARVGDAAFDLPDEVLVLVALARLEEEMGTADSVQAAALALMSVSRQFRRAARGALELDQARVRDACKSLLGTKPVPHQRVSGLLQRSGLTVRLALGLRGPWYEYVRARRCVERAARSVRRNSTLPC
jgi:hypothetical protein